MATILVIEDEAVLLGLIASTLRLDGHAIIEAGDPLSALEIVEARKNEIELVLTDVTMKPITGIALAARLTQAGINIPVLFMSGYPALAGVVTSGLGNNALIEKPFTGPGLRKAVNGFLASARRNGEPGRSGRAGAKQPTKARSLS